MPRKYEHSRIKGYNSSFPAVYRPRCHLQQDVHDANGTHLRWNKLVALVRKAKYHETDLSRKYHETNLSRLQSKLQEDDDNRCLTYCLSITALAATWRVDNIASRSCFFSRIMASSSTLLYGCPPCPVLPLMGTGMGWGREGLGGPLPPRFPPTPPPPAAAADIMAAAMLCVFGGKDAGKWGPGGGFGGNC